MSNFLLNVASAKSRLSPLFGIINQSSVLPILGDVLIVKKDKLSFVATDLENVLTIDVDPLHCEGDIEFCFSAVAFRQLLNNSLSETISFKISKEKSKANIQNGDFGLSWGIDRAEDFPKTPIIDECKSITISVNEIREHFINSLKFASNDNLRPAMTGICITDWRGELYVVATDAHKLYFSGIMKTPPAFNLLNAIVPKKGIRTFLQTFIKGNVQIDVSKAHIRFTQDNKSLICRLVDARYPEWQKVLPSNELEFSMQRKSVIAFLRMSSAFVHKSTNQIVLVVNTQGITISGGDRDFDTELNYKMPIYNCNQQFAPFRFGVNLKFLMEIAGISKDEYCKFSHSGLPTKAMIIDDRCLLMPMMLNDID